jgi:hypothetical protein
LSIRGCESYHASISALLHAAAIEALLTHMTGGVTKQVATNLACLTETGKAARDAAYREMRYSNDSVLASEAENEGRPEWPGASGGLAKSTGEDSVESAGS